MAAIARQHAACTPPISPNAPSSALTSACNALHSIARCLYTHKHTHARTRERHVLTNAHKTSAKRARGSAWHCLLYTSDAADDTPCVDL
eukprot:1158759-Pleurochrysis_carterae.AAC.1